MLRVCLLGLCLWFGSRVLAEDAPRLIVTVAPRTVSVERDGLTGGGSLLVSGQRAMLFYPNHPDDFGGSSGTGTSLSADGGATWQKGADDWPIAKTVDLWGQRFRNGELFAFGLHWVPDPKLRGKLTAEDAPASAFSVAVSRDDGRSWQSNPAVLDYSSELGVIARPLPQIIETDTGTLLMPAYAWSKTGNSMLLLRSTDRGGRWTVQSTISTAAAISKSGVPVTTPWLETSVAIARDGSLLAAMRTGSNAGASLMCARSTDGGQQWSPPERMVAGPDRRAIAGKLPTLARLPSGPLVLLTAHSKNHCRLYVSADGTGRDWSEPWIITSQSGGNAGLAIIGDDTVLISTPMNGRLNAWRATIRPEAASHAELTPPKQIEWQRGLLSWQPTPQAVAYRITPVLIAANAPPGEMETAPYAATQTRDATPQLDLSRRLVIGGTYRFEVAVIDNLGRVSPSARSAEIVVGQ